MRGLPALVLSMVIAISVIVLNGKLMLKWEQMMVVNWPAKPRQEHEMLVVDSAPIVEEVDHVRFLDVPRSSPLILFQ